VVVSSSLRRSAIGSAGAHVPGPTHPELCDGFTLLAKASTHAEIVSPLVLAVVVDDRIGVGVVVIPLGLYRLYRRGVSPPTLAATVGRLSGYDVYCQVNLRIRVSGDLRFSRFKDY